MLMLARLGLAVLLAAAASVAVAQVAPPPRAFAVSSWSTADGLPQSDIHDALVDAEGYLWLATNRGIARFDGDSFVEYPRGPLRPEHPAALRVAHDAKGDGFWFLLERTGLGYLRPDGRIVDVPTEVPLGIGELASGPGDTLWLGTEHELRRLVGTTWQRVPELAGVGLDVVRTVRIDAAGVIWLAGPAGLVRLLPGRPRRAERVRGLRCEDVADVLPDPGGTWVLTCAGLERLRPDGSAPEMVLERRDGAALLADGDALWVAGRFGIERIEFVTAADGRRRANVVFADPLELGGSSPNALVRDGGDGVWIATGGAGLRRVRPLTASRITIADGLPTRPSHHLAPDGRGGLWIGNCEGVVRWRDQHLAPDDTLRLGTWSRCAKGLLLDRARGLWVGEANLLRRIDSSGAVRTILRLTDGGFEEVMPMLEDTGGHVWYATNRGRVGWVDPSNWRPVELATGMLPARPVWSLVEDGRGGVWIGQVGTVTRVSDGHVTLRLTADDGVPSAPVRGLWADSDGSLWMATYGGGLARWRAAGGIARLRTRGGRFEEALSAIGRDASGRFWLHGDGGLTIVDAEALETALQSGQPVVGSVTIGTREGVPEGNNGWKNAWYDPVAQRVWLATVDGVATVDLSQRQFAGRRMHVRIDDVRFDDRGIAPADTVRVPSDVSRIEVWFSSPAHGAPESKRLRYRLVGYDRTWVEAGASRVARYVNPAPGTYRFEVVAERNGGGPAPASAGLVLVVLAHWWETPLARVLGIVLGCAVLWGVIRRATSSVRARNRALQREIAERERAERMAAKAARELAHVSRLATAGELATSIAHELNQPLTAVMGSAQMARRLLDAGRGADLGPTLDSIVDQSERAAGVIRSLRAFVLKRETEPTDLAPDAVVADTMRLLGQELTSRGVTVDVRDERTTPLPVHGNAVQLQQVLANLLLNAADAMAGLPAERRRVTVLLQEESPDRLRISVIDEGPGVPPEMLPQLFQPFHSTKPEGLGLGLSLSRSIVEAHGGRLWVKSEAGGGAMFHIVLPVVTP